METNLKPFLGKERPLLFRTLVLSPDLRVVVLSPHPDDFDVIGITLRVLRDNGNLIHVAVLTSGASGVEDGFLPELTSGGKAAIREEEQRASCRFFGLPETRLAFLRLDEDADGHLAVSASNFDRLRTYWGAHPADLVFLPHGNDTNAAHRRTYAMVRQILTAENRPVLALLNRDPKTRVAREDAMTLFDDEEAKWKGQLLRFHQTQHQRNLRTRGHGIDERILRVNRQAAADFGLPTQHAETFELEFFPGQPVR